MALLSLWIWINLTVRFRYLLDQCQYEVGFHVLYVWSTSGQWLMMNALPLKAVRHPNLLQEFLFNNHHSIIANGLSKNRMATSYWSIINYSNKPCSVEPIQHISFSQNNFMMMVPMVVSISFKYPLQIPYAWLKMRSLTGHGPGCRPVPTWPLHQVLSQLDHFGMACSWEAIFKKGGENCPNSEWPLPRYLIYYITLHNHNVP